MNFAESVFLWLALLFIPLTAGFLWWTWKLKQAAARRFVRARLFAQLTVGVSHPRQIFKRVLMGTGLVLALFAMAGPRWGYHEQETVSSGLDILVCIDVSRSMLADDTKPNRLTRAKLAAYDLMAVARTERLGVVAFAGDAFLQCPLTLDDEAFRQSIESLDTDIIPNQGTAIGSALREAMHAFDKESHGSRAIVIISDGEDQETGATEIAEQAARDGIRIFTLGVGTTTGTVLRIPDPYGNPVFVKDENGDAVKSKLEEGVLRKVADAGGGFYLPLQGRPTLKVLYDRGLEPLPRSRQKSGSQREWIERFQWPLGLAILLLAIEVVLPERAIRRSRDQVEVKGQATLDSQRNQK